MNKHTVRKISVGKNVMSLAAGLLAVAVSTALGQAKAANEPILSTDYQFEVVSIRPTDPNSMVNMVQMLFGIDSYNATHATLPMLIKDAYGIADKQLVMSPGPNESTRYDIEARIDSNTVMELSKLNQSDLKAAHQQMLRTLLADRFKLVTHWNEKELTVFSLDIAKGGPKLHEAKPGDEYKSGVKDRYGNLIGPHMMLSTLGGGQISAQGVSIDLLVSELSSQLNELIVDNTGLKGTYDINLRWTPDHDLPQGLDTANPDTSGASDPGPSLSIALREQLGLKLEQTKGPFKVLVVDHAEMPSEN